MDYFLVFFTEHGSFSAPTSAIMVRVTKGSISLTKKQAGLILLVFVAIVIFVGLLAGLVTRQRSCPEHDVKQTSNDGHSASDAANPGLAGETPWTQVRLPPHVIPLHYDLALYPDFYEDHGEFHGNVSITIRVDQPTRHLLVHIKDLVITSCAVAENETGDLIRIERNFSHPENEFWVTELRKEHELTSGQVVVLTLSFHGPLTGRIVGFYKSTYINGQTNETR